MSSASSTSLPPHIMVTLPGGLVWPCLVRVSARAKACRLRVEAHGKTELVLPKVHDSTAALRLLDTFLPWLGRTLDRQFSPERQQELALSLTEQVRGLVPADIVPAAVSLPLVGELWHVYRRCREEAQGVRLREMVTEEGDAADGKGAQGQLILTGAADDGAACCRALQRWLLRRAAPELERQVRHMAGRMGADIGLVRVRSQRGRWGSCSSRGDISLNCRLLLLPTHLVEHVIWHELCHLGHMDHSLRYRRHLARYAPHWKEQENALNIAWKCLPPWCLFSG